MTGVWLYYVFDKSSTVLWSKTDPGTWLIFLLRQKPSLRSNDFSRWWLRSHVSQILTPTSSFWLVRVGESMFKTWLVVRYHQLTTSSLSLYLFWGRHRIGIGTSLMTLDSHLFLMTLFGRLWTPGWFMFQYPKVMISLHFRNPWIPLISLLV